MFKAYIGMSVWDAHLGAFDVHMFLWVYVVCITGLLELAVLCRLMVLLNLVFPGRMFAVCLFPESSLCLQGCWGLFAAQYGLLPLAGSVTAPQPQALATQTLSLISPSQEFLYKGCLCCKWSAGSCYQMGDCLVL